MLESVTETYVPFYGAFDQISSEITEELTTNKVVNKPVQAETTEPVKMKPYVVIYTDGSWKEKFKAGGWSALLTCGEHWKLISCGQVETTINRMELSAVLESLKILKEPCEVLIISDSQLTVNIINQFVYIWPKKNFVSSKGTPVVNQDLIKPLIELMKVHKVKAKWVKSHTGFKDEMSVANDICDYWAQHMSDITGGNVNNQKGNINHECQGNESGRKTKASRKHRKRRNNIRSGMLRSQ